MCFDPRWTRACSDVTPLLISIGEQHGFWYGGPWLWIRFLEQICEDNWCTHGLVLRWTSAVSHVQPVWMNLDLYGQLIPSPLFTEVVCKRG